MIINKEKIQEEFSLLQSYICTELEKADGQGAFITDDWTRSEGGGGKSRILEKGLVIEKGGVNFSAVSGKTPAKILKALQLSESDFFATGVSIVIHPINPFVPIIHMNVRYFEMSDGTYWFGGGIDLTPHYIDKNEASYFHSELKKTCDTANTDFYSKFKSQADDYFFIPHRNETRGIGGIFFDRLSANDQITKNDLFDFVLNVGYTFPKVYTKIMNTKKDVEFNDKNIEWQNHRRGRYVEFNLVYDKGTKFGLDTNGRTESILMSLPPTVQWTYNYEVETDSPEEQTLALLKKGINWF